MIWHLLVYILIVLKYAEFCYASSNDENEPISTNWGKVLGSNVEYRGRLVKQFLGIPYAKPPVGELRFKKPQPIEPWSKTLVANHMPPACIQYIEHPFPPWYDDKDGKSENCLYLNMWVPLGRLGEMPSKPIPVIFWIHGGDFTVGSNRLDVYKGHALAAEGDVIVVTINYRLGAFGFFTSGSDNAPGNVGMYDIFEAFKWVHWNIHLLGGNPSRITLAGQGSGSVAVGLLATSPLLSGFFHSIIMESGSPAYMFAEDNTLNIKKSQELALKMDCATEEITIDKYPGGVTKCLREKNATEIAKALNSLHPASARTFFPSYGDELLPLNARKALIAGNFTDVPVLIGSNKDEGSFQITTSNQDIFGFFGELNPRINKTEADSIMRKIFKINPLQVIDYYLENVDDSDYERIREQVYTASGDYSIICPLAYFAESYTNKGNDVYYYSLIDRPSKSPWAEWMGVAHFEEVKYVFGVPLQDPQEYKHEEIFLSQEMMHMWSEFAEYGALSWGTYSRQRPEYNELHFRHWATYNLGPHKKNCEFFRAHFGFDTMQVNHWK